MTAFTPEQILDKMQECYSRLEIAHRVMKEHQLQKTEREKKALIIIYAQRTDLIEDVKLRTNLEAIKARKTLITKDIAEAAAYIMCKKVLEPYYEAVEEVKRTKDELDVLKNMIMEHQSKRKFKGIELENLPE